MTGTDVTGGSAARTAGLDQAIAAIAAGATALDREPRFPREAFDELAAAGALGATIGAARASASVASEWDLLRRVAAADASVGRIFDGHLNAVERLEVAADPDLRDRELAAVEAGERLLGVWGADPAPGEGEPARLHESDGRIWEGGAADGLVLRGAKTFCSGAGGLDAAMVMIGRDDGAAPALVFVECDERVEVDRSWYRAAGLRASESHLVAFHDAPAIVLGEPGELVRDPWFSRDAMRTAASWAGMVDAAVTAALDDLGVRRPEDPLARLTAGRIEAALGTVEAWLERAGRLADASVAGLDAPHLGDGSPVAMGADALGPAGQGSATATGSAAPSGRKSTQLRPGAIRATGIAMRAEIDRAAKAILAEAAAACGSYPFVTAGRLDRARRDLETFLLQHRLDPLVARLGGESLANR